MLHSKFSLSFDLDDQSVTIFIEHKVNNEKTFSSPFFYFDDNGKLIIPPNSERGYNRSTFSYLARHIKTKVATFKKYIEDQYLQEKSYNDDNSIIVGFYEDDEMKETKCIFCKSPEVTYNQLIMDSYCSDCGEWQEN